eukprot:CAMPEP_0180555782 /NCGR_PEP_ID=MMETSP1037_2-20121125/182_1 /TAXON_ID=632150 /ORGANISM="Azadinium spinosum, Strain 3D9" /LENGTH=77 /DNA_ID=CAMNT_0022571681 /DNA_START=187 /DNA_END=417 /DNA_ORIENTATION=+
MTHISSRVSSHEEGLPREASDISKPSYLTRPPEDCASIRTTFVQTNEREWATYYRGAYSCVADTWKFHQLNVQSIAD